MRCCAGRGGFLGLGTVEGVHESDLEELEKNEN